MEQTQVGMAPSNVEEISGRGEAFKAARERLNETLAGVTERAKHAAEYADQTVHGNPWTSIGVGFGVGIVIGALIALAAGSRRST